MFNIEQSDTVRPDLGWYVLTYDYNYYNDMPPKIPDLELVLPDYLTGGIAYDYSKP